MEKTPVMPEEANPYHTSGDHVVIIKTLKVPLRAATDVIVDERFFEPVPLEVICQSCGAALINDWQRTWWRYKHRQLTGCRAPYDIGICLPSVLEAVIRVLLSRKAFQPDKSIYECIARSVRRIYWEGRRRRDDAIHIELNPLGGPNGLAQD